MGKREILRVRSARPNKNPKNCFIACLSFLRADASAGVYSFAFTKPGRLGYAWPISANGKVIRHQHFSVV